jgi:hypothetical protein
MVTQSLGLGFVVHGLRFIVDGSGFWDWSFRV